MRRAGLITLEIKDIDSSDVDFGIELLERPEEVLFQVTLRIGERGGVAGDDFQVIVATPEGLRKAGSLDGDVISTRGLIVVSKFSWQLVRNTLNEIVATCADENWSRSVEKLQRYFLWEYEDYR